MRRDSGPPPKRLYHAVSIEENKEFHNDFHHLGGQRTMGETNRDLDGGLGRMSSVTMAGIRSFLDSYPSRPMEADANAQIQRGPIGGGKSGLQGWDSDLLDLPIGEGGPAGKRKLCILSLDGGGMRGLIAARILTRLEILIQVSYTRFNYKFCEIVLQDSVANPHSSQNPLITFCCRLTSDLTWHQNWCAMLIRVVFMTSSWSTECHMTPSHMPPSDCKTID